MLKIKNKCKRIKTSEIKECIQLLNKKYQNLDCVITLYQNKLQVILSFIFSSLTYLDLKNILHGRSCGIHFTNKNKIDIYTFNRKMKTKEDYQKYIKLQLIYDILHEIRHNYQNKKFLIRYPKAAVNYIDVSSNGYQTQWVEKDANEFAKTIMLKNKDDINKIFGINYFWTIS